MAGPGGRGTPRAPARDVNAGMTRLDPDDAATDPLAIAYTWIRHVLPDRADADSCTVEAVRRLLCGEVPAWLRPRSPILQLKYLSVRVVLEHRGTL